MLFLFFVYGIRYCSNSDLQPLIPRTLVLAWVEYMVHIRAQSVVLIRGYIQLILRHEQVQRYNAPFFRFH